MGQRLSPAPASSASTLTVAVSDVFTISACSTSYAQNPRGSGETSGRRIHRILDNAGHTGTRNIATGVCTVAATTLSQTASA